jgi:hypothetical protein
MNKHVWMMFYLTVVGWQYHPGNKAGVSLSECGLIADEMMKEYFLRFKE